MADKSMKQFHYDGHSASISHHGSVRSITFPDGTVMTGTLDHIITDGPYGRTITETGELAGWDILQSTWEDIRNDEVLDRGPEL